MKNITTSELTAKEAKTISHALDIARRVVNLEEDQRPDGLKYLSGDEKLIKDLSYKFFSQQVTGATITQVENLDE